MLLLLLLPTHCWVRLAAAAANFAERERANLLFRSKDRLARLFCGSKSISNWVREIVNVYALDQQPDESREFSSGVRPLSAAFSRLAISSVSFV